MVESVDRSSAAAALGAGAGKVKAAQRPDQALKTCRDPDDIRAILSSTDKAVDTEQEAVQALFDNCVTPDTDITDDKKLEIWRDLFGKDEITRSQKAPRDNTIL